MIRRFKGFLKRILGKSQPKEIPPIYIDSNKIIIRSNDINEISFDQYSIDKSQDIYVPNRKITKLEWNGSTLFFQGYFYLEGIDMPSEDFVKKELIFVRDNEEAYRVPLKDITINQLTMNDNVNSRYKWSAFEATINFSSFMMTKMPLVKGEYTLYLELSIDEIGIGKMKKTITFGNIDHFLIEGFHSATMEYFTAHRELKYNLMANYDYSSKTLKIISTKLKDIDPSELGLVDKESNDFWYRLVKTKLFKVVYLLYCLYPIKRNKVLFASDSRDDLSGNFQFVYDEIIRQKLDLDIRFNLKGSVDKKKTTMEILKLAKEIATSRYILLDDFYPMIYNLPIRKKADLVQLWHAVGAFKTFGFSRIGRPGGPSPKSKNHRNYTIATVSSKNIIKHYAEGFGVPEKNVVATGIPRTDIFFDEDYKNTVSTHLYEKYPFMKDKKIITFAPTFRGNGQQSAHYDMDALDLGAIYRELKDEYIFIFKMHPFVKNNFSIPYIYSDFFYDLSEHREINDLLFVTDVLITDYSSVCFEFALLDKPMIFFAYDVEDYVKTRDFYYEYHSFIPGPLVKTTERLVETIKTKQFKMEKIKPFKEYFFEDIDGKSSERVVEYLFNNPNRDR